VAIYLGIDGGGTKTTCWIGDENSILGRGHAGASNPLRVDKEIACAALIESMQSACTNAHVHHDQIRYAVVGLAGAARPEISAEVRNDLSRILKCPVEVLGDMTIALEAAFAGGPGVIVISGTGSIAYGRNQHGQTARAGGMGPATSDEGSGHWIGRAAGAALRESDEGQSILRDAVMKASNARALAEISSEPHNSNLSRLFPSVCLAADMGDPIAIDLLRRAGQELSHLAVAVIGKLFSGQREIPVAMVGGVFRHSELVRESLAISLKAMFPAVVLSDTVVEPVSGALNLARRSFRAPEMPSAEFS
jgi:glucosamine kinase